MNITEIKEQVAFFIDSKLSELTGDSISGKLLKPIVNVIVKNNIDKADTILNLLADKNGNIDAMSIISQYEDSLINSKEVTSIGIAEIGNGKIKINVPYFDKTINLDSSDIEELKTLLTN